MVRTNNSSNRMSVDPSRNSSNQMGMQAVNPAREEPYNPQCYHCCGDYGHIIKHCKTRPPRHSGPEGPRGRLQGRRPPPPRQEWTREEDRPKQVQQVTAATEKFTPE